MAELSFDNGHTVTSQVSAALKPPPTPASAPPPSPKLIPRGMPNTISVQTPRGMLIKPTPVDKTLLSVGANGSVVPGQQPGLYVASGVSTLPGTDQGTVIVGGHAKASNAMVFNPLSQLSKDDVNQSQVTLAMADGELTYTIEGIDLVDKVDLPTQQALADNRPGRVLLITCDLEGGNDTFQNLIVVACDNAHKGCGAT